MVNGEWRMENGERGTAERGEKKNPAGGIAAYPAQLDVALKQNVTAMCPYAAFFALVCAILTRERKASFTDFASGKNSATSFSSRTRFVPLAYSFAYFPFTMPFIAARSYAGRNSSLLVFFIIVPLDAGGLSCRYYSDCPGPVRMG